MQTVEPWGAEKPSPSPSQLASISLAALSVGYKVRTHLGVETQRQWSARAIARAPLPRCSASFLW